MNDNYDHIKDYVKNSVGDIETQLLISDFAILWNEYENELYNKEHHIYSIKKKINELNFTNNNIAKINELYCRLKEYLKFRNEIEYDKLVQGFNILIKKPKEENGRIRYYDDGSIVYTGEIFEEELIRIMNSSNIKDKLYFLLLIIARVRNNMFHGLKGIYDLKYQKDLFILCNETLKLIIDINRGGRNGNKQV